MKTAVQLRTLAGDERPRTELLFGAPSDLKEGTLGPVARFESGEVVAYQIRSRRRRHLFVFRTLDVDDAFAVALPGVRPRVQLLLELRTAGRIRLARSLFAYLVRTGRDPSALPDTFYTRVGALLGGRLPAHKILLSVLATCRRMQGRAVARTGTSPEKPETPNRHAAPIGVVQGAATSPAPSKAEGRMSAPRCRRRRAAGALFRRRGRGARGEMETKKEEVTDEKGR